MATKAKTVLVSVRVAILPATAHETESLCCLGCGADLDLSQPRTDAPGSLVGTCQGRCKHCGCCHVIDREGTGGTLMVMVPSFAVLRRATEGEDAASSEGQEGLEVAGAGLR